MLYNGLDPSFLSLAVRLIATVAERIMVAARIILMIVIVIVTVVEIVIVAIIIILMRVS